jgi:hypothetical protein
MPTLQELLSPKDVRLDQLLLDPNNPRFAELGDPPDVVPESRIAEPKVQREAYEKMKNVRFDVGELRDTIRTLGFLPMDRMVVRRWRESDPAKPTYVVVEGNRRAAALRWLLELHETGRDTLTEDQIANFSQLGVLLLDIDRAPDSARWVLPGLRHVSGIKEWGPYQKARTVFVLREAGATPQEAAQSLGLSTRSANQLWRSYLALEQMSQDEEYEEFAEPRKYSYFEEVFKRPNMRDWLGWNDGDRRFSNEERVKEFYSWVVGEVSDDGERSEPKLPEAKSVRELSRFIGDEGAMAVFRAPGGTLAQALARFEVEHPQAWQGSIELAQVTLAALTPDTLRNLQQSDVATLNALRARIEQVLEDRERLLGRRNV